MFPGLRIGYIIPPPPLVPFFRRAKWLADTQTPMLEQAVLAEFLAEGHMERHIRRMRRLYGSRREALLDSLWKHFGDKAQAMGDAAGMHVMVRFDDKSVVRRAMQNKIELVSADGYYLTQPPGNEYIFWFFHPSGARYSRRHKASGAVGQPSDRDLSRARRGALARSRLPGNLMLTGPESGNIVPDVFTPVLAKHSKSFSLIDCISVGVDRMRTFIP